MSDRSSISGVDAQRGSEPSKCLNCVLIHWRAGDGDDVMQESVMTQTKVSNTMSGAETHGPVDEVEDEEHDWEHNKEHIIHP